MVDVTGIVFARPYREWIGVAGQLDKLPADLGEGGDEWR